MPPETPKDCFTPETTDGPVSRRLALASALALGAFSLVRPGSTRAQGVHGFRKRTKQYKENKQDEPSQGWLDSIMPGRQDADAPDLPPSQTPALLAAATRAVAAGNPAREYCIKKVKGGDVVLQVALDNIQAMLPVANALAKLSELNAARLKEMASVGINFLQDCETACRLQSVAHPPCRDCAEACLVAIAECRKLNGV